MRLQVKKPMLFHSLVDQLTDGLVNPQTGIMDPAWQLDPVGWISQFLGVRSHTIRWSENPGYENCKCMTCGPTHEGPHKWDGTPDPIAAVLEGLAANQNVGVESATGTGKTFIGAATALWFSSVFPNSLVVTTAPKEQQLMLHLWKELGRNWNQFQVIYPQAVLTKLQVKMNPPHMDWLITGFACGVGADEQSATKAQGFHAEHMLIITEETPGIHSAVMTAFENTCTGDHNLRLAFGNPDHEEDTLHTFCTSPTVNHVRISALDHPNVVCDNPSIVPGAVSRRNIEERRLKYGVDSNIYRSRVRGICPSESADSLIKRSWCKAAADRYNDPTFRQGIPALGVDVANSATGDEAAIARGEGACCIEVETFPCPDANKLGTRVALEMGAYNIDERNVGVDAIGVGAGTVNELRRLRYEVQELQSAASALPWGDLTEEFGNLRAQMWWKARLDLQHNRIAMPDDEDLVKDLTAPMWEVRNGKIYIEEKKKIKARIGRSPNKGDAFVYWNWVRSPLSSVSKGGRLVTF